jgi:hypothetical protein
VQGFIDAYAVLGVAPDAEQAELKRAHRALVRRHHPDLATPADRAAATRRVQDINVAYGLVRDPAARARYDRLRAIHRAREAAAGPVRSTTAAVRRADAGAAQQWEAALRAAGSWAGRWWVRHRLHVLDSARRVRRAGVDLYGRVLWLVSCALWLAIGFVVATAAQRLAGEASVVVPLVGAATGLLVGHRRGWRRRLRMAGVPAASAHRLRGWAELAAGGALLALVVGGSAVLPV